MFSFFLTGSRKVFGSIIEQNVILLVDVSGSMVTSIDELKTEMNSIIWEQIHKNCIKYVLFNKYPFLALYLQALFQIVQIANSDDLETCGIPQGSYLGLLFFMIYRNDSIFNSNKS